MTIESTDGFVRVVARRDNHLIVGWQAVGRGVSELSAAFSQSIEMGARLEDVAGTIHAHPTLGEAVQEAALRALVKSAFAHRRKTLRNNLKAIIDTSKLEALGIDPGARAETLQLTQFIEIANALHDQHSL